MTEIGASAEFAAIWLTAIFGLALVCQWGVERGFSFRNLASAVIVGVAMTACVILVMLAQLLGAFPWDEP
jgi:hypothetical protein